MARPLPDGPNGLRQRFDGEGRPIEDAITHADMPRDAVKIPKMFQRRMMVPKIGRKMTPKAMRGMNMKRGRKG